MTQYEPMTKYEVEPVDRLPFSTPEKSERYRTENYRGAVASTGIAPDPTLQLTMAYYLQPDELAVVEPHLSDIGRVDGRSGGPVAEQTDRNPARLERYDRWGHDVSQVVQPTSFIESKRAVLSAQKALKDDLRQSGIASSLPLFGANYLLDQADIGMGCAWEQAAAWSSRWLRPMHRPTCASMSSGRFASGEWEGETAQLLTERAGGSDLGALETTATRQADGCTWLINGFQVVCVQLRRPVLVFRRAGQARGRPGPPSSGAASFLGAANPSRRTRNGIRIRRLKDKLGTRSVASGEVELVDAEAFLLSGQPVPRSAQQPTSPPRRAALGRQGSGPDDGADQRRTSRDRPVRPGQRAARPGRIAVLRPAAAGVRRPPARQAVDAPQLTEMIVDVEAAQRWCSTAWAWPNQPPAQTGAAADCVPVTQLRVCRLGHQRWLRRDRDPRRQRLYRNMAGGKAIARRSGQHHLGGRRQHPVPRRAAGGSSASVPTNRCWSDSTTRSRCPDRH